MGKVIGIGGIFMKFEDPKKMNAWYSEVLGLTGNAYGVMFQFNHKVQKGYLQLGTFPKDSKYFGDENQQAMINFRVDNLESMIVNLNQHQAKILDEIETYDFGKFLHIEDPEGNRIELWEPADESQDSGEPYTEMN